MRRLTICTVCLLLCFAPSMSQAQTPNQTQKSEPPTKPQQKYKLANLRHPKDQLDNMACKSLVITGKKQRRKLATEYFRISDTDDKDLRITFGYKTSDSEVKVEALTREVVEAALTADEPGVLILELQLGKRELILLLPRREKETLLKAIASAYNKRASPKTKAQQQNI